MPEFTAVPASDRHAARNLRRGTTAALLVGVAGMVGCETDSFIDPSVTGRWENTPTIMPILDRVSTIEDEPAEYVRAEPIQPQDLIPEVEQYRFGPGDVLDIGIRDFVAPGQEERFQVNLDSRGYVYIPKLRPIRAQGLTNLELNDVIRDAVADAQIRQDAVVSVNILSQRSQTYSVLGAVVAPQEYFIPQPNYRLLQAITAAGGVNETIEKLYVIRQVALSDQARGVAPAPTNQPDSRPPTAPTPAEPPPQQDPNRLLDLIDELTKPKDGEPGAQPQPGMLRAASSRRGQPEDRPAEVPAPPAIDLPGAPATPAAPGAPAAPATPPPPASPWKYENGQWTKRSPGSGGLVEGMTGAAGSEPVVTQRIIEIPMAQLLAGDASVNIVVRPGDVIRVPPPKTGVVYLAGFVARPGTYTLSGDTKLTLLRGLDSAGGLNSLAIPERTDLTRIVGPGRQATIRLNLRAIAEQTQPDIYLKPDDRINVGTNFWAFPLAVTRGGFRASYGYGFILDRNFSGDVFGADRSVNR